MKFRTDVDGVITALRYYKSTNATGTRTANLWASTGATPLASAVFTNESASGWQEVALTTPVPVTAGSTYVVSYFSSSGDFVITPGFFTSQQAGSGLVRGLQSGTDGPNGVYAYTPTSTRPVNNGNGSNYYADVVFSPNTSQLGQSITFPTIGPQTLAASPLTVSATASSGLPVSFSSLTSAVCTVSGTTVILNAAGDCTLQADQAGNASYSAAPPVAQTFTVTAGLLAQTITFPAIPQQALAHCSLRAVGERLVGTSHHADDPDAGQLHHQRADRDAGRHRHLHAPGHATRQRQLFRGDAGEHELQHLGITRRQPHHAREPAARQSGFRVGYHWRRGRVHPGLRHGHQLRAR